MSEKAQQLSHQVQMLETYFANLSQQEADFVNLLQSTVATIDSIRSLHEKPESDTLIPIGKGIYIQTRVSSDKKIILDVGAGVLLEKDFPSTINHLESRIKEINVALQEVAAKKEQAAASLEQSRGEIAQLMQSTMPQNPGK